MKRSTEGPQPAPTALPLLLRAAAMAWAAFAISNAIYGRPRAVAVDLVVLGGTAVVDTLLRRWPTHWRAAVHSALAASCGGIFGSCALANGDDAVAWYFAAVPLFALHVAGRPAGIFWSAVAAALFVVAVFDPWQLTPEIVPDRVERAYAAVLLISLTAAFGWLARRESEQRVAALTKAAYEKGEILASISHEIRTPLHGMLGLASVLDETPLSSAQRDVLDALRSSGRSLHRIVDDVLDVARIESGLFSIELAAADLHTTLEDIIDLYATDAAQKRIALVLCVEGAENLSVLVDEVRVRQIVSNLVGNAVKFTARGSVRVAARAVRTGERAEIAIRVEDTGPGIPADRVERLFVAYDRLDTKQARLHGGTGLGLALARDLALRMGAALVVDLDRKEGTALELQLSLPLVAAEPAARAERVHTALLLECEPAHVAAARSTARALKDEVELVVVESLGRALEAIAGRRFDAVIVASSEGLDVVSACQRLREMAPTVPLFACVSPAVDRLPAIDGKLLAGSILRPLRRSRLRALVARNVRPPPSSGRSEHTALVVDDDPTNRRILITLLEHRGWSAQPASSASAALRRIAEHSFHVVFSDLHMPEESGVELALRLRSLARPPYLAAVTASVRDDDRMRCLDAGFDAFLRKPFQPSELDEILHDAVRRLAVEAPTESAPLIDEATWLAFEQLLGDDAAVAFDEQASAARDQVGVLSTQPDDAERCFRAVHTLKSSAHWVGLRALSDAAKKLELSVAAMSSAEREAEGRKLEILLAESLDALARARRARSAQSFVA